MSAYDSPFFTQGFWRNLYCFNGGNDFLAILAKIYLSRFLSLAKAKSMASREILMVNGKYACNTTRRGESCAMEGKHVWYLSVRIITMNQLKLVCLLSCKIQRALQVPIASSKILIQMQTQIYETHLFFFVLVPNCTAFLPKLHKSGQMIIFHQPRFPSKIRGFSRSLSYLFGAFRSCFRSRANLTRYFSWNTLSIVSFTTFNGWPMGTFDGVSVVGSYPCFEGIPDWFLDSKRKIVNSDNARCTPTCYKWWGFNPYKWPFLNG